MHVAIFRNRTSLSHRQDQSVLMNLGGSWQESDITFSLPCGTIRVVLDFNVHG